MESKQMWFVEVDNGDFDIFYFVEKKFKVQEINYLLIFVFV